MRLRIKQLIMVLTIASFLFYPLHFASADAWGANFAAAILKETLEKITKNIEGVILGALKTSAATMISSIINQLISGGGLEGALFVLPNKMKGQERKQLPGCIFLHSVGYSPGNSLSALKRSKKVLFFNE